MQQPNQGRTLRPGSDGMVGRIQGLKASGTGCISLVGFLFFSEYESCQSPI